MTFSPLSSRLGSFLYSRAATLGGAALGFILGWYGLVFGVVLGAIVDALRWQSGTDRQLAEWFENPGCKRIEEPLPGIAAFCALGIVLLLENTRDMHRKNSPVAEESELVWKVGLLASTLAVSLQDQRAVLENMARTAFGCREQLNPDLLVEVLVARCRQRGDIEAWLSLLEALCVGTASRRFFDRIVRGSVHRKPASRASRPLARDLMQSPPEADAWTIMGLAPGASKGEIARVYRRLARQFHPDALHGLDEEHLRQAANAFLRIDGAYRFLRERPSA